MAAISSQELVDPVPRTGFDVWVIFQAKNWWIPSLGLVSMCGLSSTRYPFLMA